MKKIKKISILGAAITTLMGNAAFAEDKTLVDFLNVKNVAFLIVNYGTNTRLTTFDWQNAADSCKTIKNAGLNVNNIRNVDSETQIISDASCRN